MRAGACATAISSALLLAACAQPAFRAEPGPGAAALPCPPVKSYTREEQARAAQELELLAPGAMLGAMMDDYHLLREACRAR